MRRPKVRALLYLVVESSRSRVGNGHDETDVTSSLSELYVLIEV